MTALLFIIPGLLLTFLVVVAVHEFGHLFVGRKLGAKPVEFSMGFGRILTSRPDRHGTLWQLRAIPLGGFVKFAGDTNAASLAQAQTGPVVPGSLASLSLPRRAAVAAAGPAVNLVLAALIFAGVSLAQGQPSDPWRLASVHPVFEKFGFRAGDIVTTIEAQPEQGEPATDRLAQGDWRPLATTYTIARDRASLSLSAPLSGGPFLGRIVPGSAADLAGLQSGDLIVGAGGQAVDSWEDLRAALIPRQVVSLAVLRDGELLRTNARLTEDGTLGVHRADPFEIARDPVGLGHALVDGVSRTGAFVSMAVSGMGRVLLGREDPCNLHGPVRIAALAGQTLQLGPLVFAQFLAVISASLGLMNLAPIPGLDGGHLLIYGLEGARGRPLPQLAVKLIFILGMTLLVFLILTALLADLAC